MDINEILKKAVADNISDIFLVTGRPIAFRKDSTLQNVEQSPLASSDTRTMISELYVLADHRDMSQVLTNGDDDFSLSVPQLARFRVNAFKQRGSLSAVIRVIQPGLPSPEMLGIPPYIISLSERTKGMILVTGPAGSGKSTTLACMIDHLNQTRALHIITLEDPIERLHSHGRSIVSQREINSDTRNYVTALRAALRQSPDVILLGEMRDYETMEFAMTAAETGHLLFSTLHTIGAANTIDRIIDVFPANQQHQISVQLSMVLDAVISQQLIPSVDGTLIPAFEIMTVNPAIRNMIRENKIHQIDGLLYSSAREDMISMDSSLLKLYHEKRITRETALLYATNPEMLGKKLG